MSRKQKVSTFDEVFDLLKDRQGDAPTEVAEIAADALSAVVAFIWATAGRQSPMQLAAFVSSVALQHGAQLAEAERNRKPTLQ